jgi:hypothetical protein
MPGRMTRCDERLEPTPCGQQGVSLIDAEVDLKGDAEALEVWEDFRVLFGLLRWQTVPEEFLLTLVVQAGLDPLPDGALGIAHDDLCAPQLANTGGLATMIAMEVGDDQPSDVAKLQEGRAACASDP